MLAPSFSARAGARLRTAVVAVVATLAIVDCSAAYPSSAGGPLSGTLAVARDPAVTLAAVLSDAPGTYIDHLLAERDSTIERWPDRTVDPLRVWIDSGAIVGGARASFPAAVRAAFADWAATGIPVRFVYVASPHEADVRVRWTQFLRDKTGSTTWRTDREGWMTASDITLATHVGTGSELDPEGVHAIALHEVGHALGLSHSEDPHDIMAPLVRVRSLSAADRATIRLVYSVPAGRLD